MWLVHLCCLIVLFLVNMLFLKIKSGLFIIRLLFPTDFTPSTVVFPVHHNDSSNMHEDDLFSFAYFVPDLNEIHDIIKQIRSNAAPGPDGLNATFYKSAWHWAKDDIYKVVTNFYAHATLHPDLNRTFISIIPKNSNPTIPQDYRPIDLCNVIYKIIVTSLANRVKNHPPNYVSQAQSAFIAHRHISSNIIITQEIIHSFNLKSWNSNAFLLKIDLAKAFDRLEWTFISDALHRIGFNDKFINLIHTCISTSSLAVLVNDEPSNYFNPQRGLRQGCSLSPYLFVIAINELSIRLQEALSNNNLSGISLGVGAPPIHSLLFADDLILCGKATLEEAQAIKTILYEFCQKSGQTPNLQKSSIYFSKNVPNHIRTQIKGIFPVPNLQPNTMHLGHPMIFSHRDKNRAYNFIYNKFIAKFGTLKANKLNHAGRLQYIKSVLASIPIYYMSSVLLSKTFIEKINTIIRRFWWTGVQEELDTTPISYRSWDDICKPKEQGGLGIRDMETVKGVFGRAPQNSRSNKTTPLHFFPAKHLNSKNSRSTKSMDLAPNSTKSMECLQGYSADACFVLTRGVG
jgi:hypothetical protein